MPIWSLRRSGGGAPPRRPLGIRALFPELLCHDFCLVRFPYQTASDLLPPLTLCPFVISFLHVGLTGVHFFPGCGGVISLVAEPAPVNSSLPWKVAPALPLVSIYSPRSGYWVAPVTAGYGGGPRVARGQSYGPMRFRSRVASPGLWRMSI